MVTLKDIAEKAGVSMMTGSRVMNGNQGKVSEKTAARIRALADEMGYKSPSTAKMMSAKKSYNIGVVVSERYLDQYESFYWQMYQAVATKAVSKECFTMLEVLGTDAEQNLELPKILKEHKVEGLIILGLLKEDYLNMMVQNMDVPFF